MAEADMKCRVGDNMRARSRLQVFPGRRLQKEDVVTLSKTLDGGSGRGWLSQPAMRDLELPMVRRPWPGAGRRAHCAATIMYAEVIQSFSLANTHSSPVLASFQIDALQTLLAAVSQRDIQRLHDDQSMEVEPWSTYGSAFKIHHPQRQCDRPMCWQKKKKPRPNRPQGYLAEQRNATERQQEVSSRSKKAPPSMSIHSPYCGSISLETPMQLALQLGHLPIRRRPTPGSRWLLPV
jgi:hypothetical protein